MAKYYKKRGAPLKSAAEPARSAKTTKPKAGKSFLFIGLALVLALVLFVPRLFENGGSDSDDSINSGPAITYQPSSGSQSTEASSDTLHLSLLNEGSPNAEKVELVVSDCLVEEPINYTVTSLRQAEDKTHGVKVYRYDISSEQIMESLNGFMEIRIPYDETYFAAGEDPAACLGAYTVDEDGVTKPELFDVDTEAKEVIIYTPHLSERQIYHYRDALTAEKYEVNFGNTLVGNLSFDDCAKFIQNEGSFYSLSEYEDKYYASRGAIELLMNAGFGIPLKLIPQA